MTKLTMAQQNAIREVAAGAVTKRNCGIGAWRICGPIHPTVVGRVISMKLATWSEGEGEKVAVLTEAGRKILPI